MIRLGRLVALIGTALAIAVAMGFVVAGGAAAKSSVSPCGTAESPTWSPDGTQIAWFGVRWPRPANGHATGTYNTLRAICVSDANGKNLHELADTVCSERCSNALSEGVGQLEWVQPNMLLAGNDAGIVTVPIGQKPKSLARTGPTLFSTDANGDRVASGLFGDGCLTCAGPVKVLTVPSGAVVGNVGGTRVDNGDPSLSHDGTQVVFSRTPSRDNGVGPSIWTAAADGSHLHELEKHGGNPLWSPTGSRIAYLAPSGSRFAVRVVGAQGGGSTTLLKNDNTTLYGWSPNGRWIAFPDSKGRLAVVDVATKKVRTLLKSGVQGAAWSPDSQQLLVVWKAPAHSSCPSGLWRVPVSGGKPHLVHGC